MAKVHSYIVGEVSLPPSSGEALVFAAAEKKLRAAGLYDKDAVYAVYRRSVDARKKNDVRFVYSVMATGDYPALSAEDMRKYGIKEQVTEAPKPVYGKIPLSHRPVIVGAGPAGLFAGLLLAENGYAPIILERGGSVAERANANRRFAEARLLDPECNVQFGAGGAGTFSDGKLVTRVSDPLTGYVLRRFAEFGAPPEILRLSKPHIGTDYLQKTVDNMIAAIEKNGGEVHFHTRVDAVRRTGDAVTSLVTSKGEIPVGAAVFAVGNSAREFFRHLIAEGYKTEAKPFSMGVRIEHLQKDIDAALYGRFAEGHGLPPAEYQLSFDTKARGVYTFCMCPGGEVVAAASDMGGVVVNGMSNHKRDGKNANSALLVSVFPSDFGADPVRAMAMQREIEARAFRAAGGDYAVPLSTVGDFLSGGSGTLPSRIASTYMGGNAFRPVSPTRYLPDFITSGMRRGLSAFDQRLRGFAAPDALLSGPETRTSSPLRILRGEGRTALGTTNLYPAGEGAGYAGGITSAALDGIHSALALMERFRPYL